MDDKKDLNENIENQPYDGEVESENTYEIPEDIKIYPDAYIESRNTIKEEKKKKKRKGFKGSLSSYIAVALVASIVGGISSSYIGPKLYGSILPNPNGYNYKQEAINISTSDDINTVSAVVKKSMSSVVGITTVELQQNFFMETEVEGVGTGVIIGSDGYILTNSHVIGNGNARSIEVLFENGDKLPANVLWFDQAQDMALIKVEATGLPVATLGDSDSLEVGEIAIAIGNPLGLDFQRTVTSGIISGLNRSIRVSENTVIDNLIQTDASINRGNSGGPLLNSKGEVIGINTAKIQTGEGLGFSIPINDIKPVVESVLKNGEHKVVYMGIAGITVEEYQSVLGIDMDNKDGIILIEVAEDSPASRSGLQIGDIITEIDGVKINSMKDLKSTLYKYEKGDKAEIEVVRSAEKLKIQLIFDQEK